MPDQFQLKFLPASGKFIIAHYSTSVESLSRLTSRTDHHNPFDPFLTVHSTSQKHVRYDGIMQKKDAENMADISKRESLDILKFFKITINFILITTSNILILICIYNVHMYNVCIMQVYNICIIYV